MQAILTVSCLLLFQMRILFTSRQKLLNSNTRPLLSELIQETEIRGLSDEAAIRLFSMTYMMEVKKNI
jgi:hypothetical protein